MNHPYNNFIYAKALSDDSLHLDHSDCYVIKRQIENTCYYDLAGVYPITPMVSTAPLIHDFNHLMDFVSLVWVSDIFITPPHEQCVEICDFANDFKTHYYYDPHQNLTISKHHRYEIKNAKGEVQFIELGDYLDNWFSLYQTLVKHHEIKGVSNFTKEYFKNITTLPELKSTAVFYNNEIIAMHLWLHYDNFVYSHLAASSQLGYQHRANYLIYKFILEHYYEYYIDFGGIAGDNNDPSHGLARFKRGFANNKKNNYIYGKILNNEIYQELIRKKQKLNYFPAYRGN